MHKYYVFTFLYNFALGSTCTLYVPWLHEIGISYAGISLINIYFWMAVLLFELPTGLFADRRGRGFSIITGALVAGFGDLYYSTARTLTQAIIAEVVVALGCAFISGALSAWIVDAKDRTEPLRSVYARAAMIRGLAFMIGPFAGLYANRISPHGFWILAGSMRVVAGAFAFWYMAGKGHEHTTTECKALRMAWARLKRSPHLKFSVLAQATVGLFGAFNLYWVLFLSSRLTAQELSWVWALMYMSLAFTGWMIRTRHGMGVPGHVGLMVALLAGALPLMLFGATKETTVWLLFIVIHEMGHGAFGPFMEAYIAEHVGSAYRATYGSLQSLIGSMGNVLALGATALFMSKHPPTPETIMEWWWMVGAAICVVCGLLWSFRPRT